MDGCHSNLHTCHSETQEEASHHKVAADQCEAAHVSGETEWFCEHWQRHTELHT